MVSARRCSSSTGDGSLATAAELAEATTIKRYKLLVMQTPRHIVEGLVGR